MDCRSAGPVLSVPKDVKVDWRSVGLVSVPVGAEVLGQSRSTVYEAVKLGQIPSMKISGRYKIPTAWLKRIVDGDVPMDGAA